MKVLIVDDEAVVRIGLKSMIDWEKNGFILAGEASDGCKAMDIIKSSYPDIVITDIKMPVMDGLSLIRDVNATLSSKPVFIVLSGYGDFHLVKEAMKLGAKDYLLKLEMEPEQLLNALNKVRTEIKENVAAEYKKSVADSQIKKNMYAMRTNFFREIINKAFANEKDFHDAMEFLNIKMPEEKILCLKLKIGELYRFEDLATEELNTINHTIVSLSEEVINDVFKSYCFEGKTGEFFILASLKGNEGRLLLEKEISDVSQRFIRMLKYYLNVTAVIGVGEGNGNMEGICTAYLQATEALKYRFFSENNCLIYWKDVKGGIGDKSGYSILPKKDIMHDALLFKDRNAVIDIFKAISGELSEFSLSREDICSVLLEMFYIICEFFEMFQEDPKKILVRSYRPYNRLICMVSLTEVKEWVGELQQDLVAYIANEEKKDYPRILSQARKYIDRHYAEEISLTEVAGEVNLNRSYFSTLFKQHFNMGFTEYVNQKRIERAKALLKDTGLKINEISRNVGYQNIYYFSRIFKKITSMTPVEYKNSIKI